MYIRLALLCCLALASPVAMPADLEFRSGPERTTLIELYTSEGCSSCPPAEAWMNRLARDSRVWRDFVPVAFHVDYWNYLGWTDRFSRPGYGQRQRHYARVLGQPTVYTPAFFVNGQPWRPGNITRMLARESTAPGELAVRLNGHQVSARLSAADRPGPFTLNIAVLGMGLRSDIRAGENAGRRARHDFVVLAASQLKGHSGKWQTTLPRVGAFDASRYALAAWISSPGDPRPLQATGGYLPRALVVSP
ncbi:MAG: DUF1223 domain-containing protein [Acidiferrobacteraceae bacterium]|jgi:hypothetical protein